MSDRKFYIVSAVINGVGVPTFHLDADILGIMDEDHAERIAKRILTALQPLDACDMSVGEDVAYGSESATDQVRHLRSGGGALINLTTEEVQDIVVSFSPYGHAAREDFFMGLRDAADARAPCQYDRSPGDWA